MNHALVFDAANCTGRSDDLRRKLDARRLADGYPLASGLRDLVSYMDDREWVV